MAVPFRLELFPKSPEDLRMRLLPFISQQQLWRVNLPNKVCLQAEVGGEEWRARPPPRPLQPWHLCSLGSHSCSNHSPRACAVHQQAKSELPALLEHVQRLRATMPGTVIDSVADNICVHFSISQNYVRSADASFAVLEDFACKLGAELQRHRKQGSVSLLLVSGSQRRQLDSVAALQRLADSQRFRGLHPPLPLAVAFNPYFPDKPRQLEERRRLQRKLEAGRGLVTTVYLQVGRTRGWVGGWDCAGGGFKARSEGAQGPAPHSSPSTGQPRCPALCTRLHCSASGFASQCPHPQAGWQRR